MQCSAASQVPIQPNRPNTDHPAIIPIDASSITAKHLDQEVPQSTMMRYCCGGTIERRHTDGQRPPLSVELTERGAGSLLPSVLVAMRRKVRLVCPGVGGVPGFYRPIAGMSVCLSVK
ncbi:unnamed protein product [Nezara viridula]|uniref:Uncharacterized protein n=1 Tax=Nezara viridula TaxID=85310 RepID=A0A9P0HCZ4_NEZVI|nr:unnamed protein product [Nezara viridula]